MTICLMCEISQAKLFQRNCVFVMYSVGTVSISKVRLGENLPAAVRERFILLLFVLDWALPEKIVDQPKPREFRH